jgi:glycosyltransferase involved in cell wall biosynthesis
MNILFNTYPIAFHTPGGGEIQLMQTKTSLERLGENVMLFDTWAPQIDKSDVVHHFSVYGGSSVFCNFIKSNRKPLAVSSILYPHKDIDRYPMTEINHILQNCDIVLPNSFHEGELISRVCNVPIEKFYPVYNGVDELFISKPDFDGLYFREYFGVMEPFLLCVANIEHRKNQLALARSLSKTNLVLLGNIRDQTYFDEMIRVSNGKIRYLGYLPNDSKLLRSAYLACEAFVLPSLLETPGLAALEAAAMGAKVVITSVGSTREYFGEYVNYRDPEDEESFLPAINASLEESKSTNLQSYVKSNFSWNRAAISSLEAYKKII